MKVLPRVIVLASFVGYIFCQSINDLDDGEKKYTFSDDNLNDIKKTIEENLPDISELENFNKTKLPNAEDVENAFKEKCKKNGAEDAVGKLKEQQENVKGCIENYVNTTVVQAELEEAKKTGSMDEVFGKYCKKWPSIYKCLDDVTLTVRSCMDESEEKAFNKSLDILSELQEFMCFKNGDRLAMFVAEGGVECVEQRKQGIQDCLNATLGTRLPDTNDISFETLPSFSFSHRDCGDFDTIRICVNKELEQCKDSTPANIVDAFFKFLKKHMPCQTGGVALKSEKLDPAAGGARSLAASTLLLVGAVISLRMY